MPNPIGSTRRYKSTGSAPAVSPKSRPQSLGPLLRALGSPVARLNERGHVAVPDRRIDLERARDDEPCLVGHRKRLQRVPLEQRVDGRRQLRGTSALARKARENARLSAARRTASELSRVQTPRPGNLQRMSGTTEPSAEIAKRSIVSGAPLAPDTMQVRSGPLSSRSVFVRNRSSLLRRMRLAFSGFGRRRPEPRSNRLARVHPESSHRPAPSSRRSC